MTVIDIRNIFSDRHVELVDVNPNYIYYAEEKNEDGRNDLYILEYNRRTRKERLIMNYSLDDPTYIQHIFAFEKTIVLLLENGGNSFWLIEIEKKSGGEMSRRKIVCTGCFKDCMALDSEHILVYMSPDEDNADIFERYKELTGCDSLCYLYNIKTNHKYFVNAPLISRIGCENLRMIDIKGESYLILPDPFADESIKEHYYREQRWINADIRDNIWICRTDKLIEEIEAGLDRITKQCIVSADIKALVRYLGTGGSKVYFRAKEFRSGIEKICSYDILKSDEPLKDRIAVEATTETPKDGTVFLIEERPFKVFSVQVGKHKTGIKGMINSQADFTFENDLGSFLTCIENRYCVSRKTVTDEDTQKSTDYYCIYDSVTDKHESYKCNCHIKGDTLVLY